MTTPIPLTQALTAVQNGTLAQAIADVCAERDRLRKENAILQEANRGLAEQGERLRADCAAMQSALEIATDTGKHPGYPVADAYVHAESVTEAPPSYVPADKARVIAEALLKSYEFISTAEKLYGREPAWIMAGGPSLIPQLDADLAIARELGLLESPQ
jgi:hypothetical protein